MVDSLYPFLSWALKKSRFLFVWIGLFFFAGILPSSAEDIEIGRNIEKIEHKVIRLNVPFKQSNRAVLATFFGTNAGRHYMVKRWILLREGDHAYEMRSPELKGHVSSVMLSVEEGMGSAGLKGEVASPSLRDELDIFLKPQQVLPKTINDLEEQTLLGMTWNVWIVLLFVVALTLFYFFLKQPFLMVLFLAFWVAWSAVDLRAIFDHFCIIETTRKNGYWMDATFSRVQTGFQKPLKEMGDKTWTLDESWDKEYPVGKPIINYMFAEKKFFPRGQQDAADLLFNIKDGELRVRVKS